MIGIYKITSPTKKVYIGQSINVEKRINEYKRIYNCKVQIRLHRSLLKHGSETHKFEIIEECEVSELNDKERYYQDIFECIGKNGLNCKLTTSKDKSGFISEETRLKMKGPKSEQHKINNSIAAKKRYRSPEEIKKATETILKANRERSKILSEDHKKKLSVWRTGRKFPNLSGKNNVKSKPVLDLNTAIFYESIKEAAKYNCVSKFKLQNSLSGKKPYKTHLILI